MSDDAINSDEPDALVEMAPNFMVENFSSNIVVMKNKSVVHLIDSFILETQNKLCAFLRKNITLKFSTIESCCLDELHPEPDETIATFSMSGLDPKGFIILPQLLIDCVINALYGGDLTTQGDALPCIGEMGKRLAKKIAELCITAFGRTSPQKKNGDISLDKITDFTHFIPEGIAKYTLYKLIIDFTMEEVNLSFMFSFPECYLDEIEPSGAQDTDKLVGVNNVNTQLLEKELSESSITLVAFLPEIPIKMGDIMKLKSGDIIPISDPNILYLSVNHKKLFKGLVGSNDTSRVVKVTEIF